MTSRRARPARAAATAGAAHGDPAAPTAPPAPSPTSRFALTLAAVLVVAALLRVWRIGLGASEFLDEAIPLRLALAMRDLTTGRVDWNPHDFIYPSLSIYVQFAIQHAVFLAGLVAGQWSNWPDYFLAVRTDPGGLVIASRLFGVVCDVATVAGTAFVARRLHPAAAIPAALFAAGSATMIQTSREIFTDLPMNAAAVWALERMLAWREHGGRGRLASAAVLLGLAVGAKYPAIVLLVPFALVALQREGLPGLRAWAALAAGTLLVFVITTPFALLEPSSFVRDAGFVRGLASQGHLGSLAGTGFAFHARRLPGDLAWVGLAMLALAVAGVALDREWRKRSLPVWLALLGFAVPISTAHIVAVRYLIPVIPLAAALGCAASATFWARRVARPLPALAFAAVVGVPALLGGLAVAARGADHTRLLAAAWCERNLPPDALVVSQEYGPTLASSYERDELLAQPIAARASEAARERVRRRTAFRFVELPLFVSGEIASDLRFSDGRRQHLRVFDHPADFNASFYDPRLFAGADVFVTSDAVTARFAQDSMRFAAPLAFEQRLARDGEMLARFESRGSTVGPTIVVWRITDRARAGLGAEGPLEPLWWAERVPAAYREAATAALGAPREGSAGVRGPDGEPAPWVTTLRGLQERSVRRFSHRMSVHLAEAGRWSEAVAFARATLDVDPADLAAYGVASECLAKSGRWDLARVAAERTLAALPPDRFEPDLVFRHALARAISGDPEGARSEAEQLLGRLDPASPLAERVRGFLASFGTTGR